MSNQKVTIYDIANYLGISTATVSRAMNNDEKIAEHTLLKVRSAMNELGYVTKKISKRQGRSRDSIKKVSKKKKRTILFLGMMDDSFSSRSLQWVQEYLNEDEYNITFGHILFAEKSILEADGIVLGCAIEDANLRKLLRKKPTVQFLGNIHNEEIPLWDQVTYNNERVGQLAAEYLIRKNYKKVAIFHQENNRVATVREKSFSEVCEKKNIEVTKCTIEKIDEQIFYLRNTNNMPEGIFVFNTLNTVAVYGGLLKAGFNPISDVDIITCDNDRNLLGVINPKPTVIDIHPQLMARRAVQQLLLRMESPFEHPESICIEPVILYN